MFVLQVMEISNTKIYGARMFLAI